MIRQYDCAPCEYYRGPRFHSGYTGKSGPETWAWCALRDQPLREIRSCHENRMFAQRRKTEKRKRDELLRRRPYGVVTHLAGPSGRNCELKLRLDRFSSDIKDVNCPKCREEWEFIHGGRDE